MAHHFAAYTNIKTRGIAQLVEQRSPKPRAEGSSPSAPATFQKTLDFSRVFCYFHQPYTIFTRFHTGLAFTINQAHFLQGFYPDPLTE